MLKTGAGVIAVILTFAGYIPYLRDVFAGKTKPHIYSWFLWGFDVLIGALGLWGVCPNVKY
jgi:hypothetical protein